MKRTAREKYLRIKKQPSTRKFCSSRLSEQHVDTIRGASSNSRERKETLSGSTRRFDPDSGKSWSQCSRKQENRQDREVTKIEKEKWSRKDGILLYITCPHPELSKAQNMRAHPRHCTTAGRHRTSQQFQRETPRRWADLGKDFVTNGREACRGGPARTLHLSKELFTSQ